MGVWWRLLLLLTNPNLRRTVRSHVCGRPAPRVGPRCVGMLVRGETTARDRGHGVGLHVVRSSVGRQHASSETAEGISASASAPQSRVSTTLVSDPHAWLYSLCARLSETHTFQSTLVNGRDLVFRATLECTLPRPAVLVHHHHVRIPLIPTFGRSTTSTLPPASFTALANATPLRRMAGQRAS